MVKLEPGGRELQRSEVREVVIRGGHGSWCDGLVAGVIPLALFIYAVGEDEHVWQHLPLILVGAPVFTAMAAATAPPLLIIRGVQQLVPAKVLYRVTP